MTSQYNRYNNSKRSAATRREFDLTEEMKELLPISKVLCKDKKMFLHNGKTDPIEVPYFVNDIPKTINGLNQILINSLGCTKEIAVKWSKLLSDVWLESESSEDEDEMMNKGIEFVIYLFRNIRKVFLLPNLS